MSKHPKPPRILIWCTLCVFVAMILTTHMIAKTNLPEGIDLNVSGQPTLGSPHAKVHAVIFEELKCSNCREFSLEVFPRLKQEYVDTGKIRYTMVPVVFLPNSMPAAITALSLYHQKGSELYFKFIDYLYAHEPLDENLNWATPELLLDWVKKVDPTVDLVQIRQNIERGIYQEELQKNTEYGKHVMNGQLATPTLYVNGIKIYDMTYEDLKALIENVRKREEMP